MPEDDSAWLDAAPLPVSSEINYALSKFRSASSGRNIVPDRHRPPPNSKVDCEVTKVPREQRFSGFRRRVRLFSDASGIFLGGGVPASLSFAVSVLRPDPGLGHMFWYKNTGNGGHQCFIIVLV
ncbi:hypothetical protein MPTK1_2g19390 [Marchantia polymorpha subsp. ruderalis]|uniref:Uncharacterized protein n=1 Tax=Marchantia polymorpha TaxID=3197 RepID=A0A2R6WVI1_MARPO|nr:hypothetical protein MARPO_0055s0113 [Marchantia polymorpha]BBN02929.1 hypothetical protein Mp_2g19390 [Marchantia polymorpha subsp. ruderalis]|eukprot:PTQ37863.1 hypothetical protein MARPO_0055s0113 [Marchantia polymorpha]